jgi:hypothetical protein
MANVQRYRTGRISEVRGVVFAGVLAEIGDLVALDSNKVTTFTGLATTSALFADKFLGVLVQGATVGTETTDTACLVYTEGEFEFPLSATAAAIVDVGGLVKATADQVVATGSVIADAIGRLCKPVAVGDTTCVVKIQSVVALGGAQAAS